MENYQYKTFDTDILEEKLNQLDEEGWDIVTVIQSPIWFHYTIVARVSKDDYYDPDSSGGW